MVTHINTSTQRRANRGDFFHLSRSMPWPICPNTCPGGRLCVLLSQVKVADQPLTSFAIHEEGGLVAVGGAEGSVTLLRLSKGLQEMAPNERQGINAMFERETLR